MYGPIITTAGQDTPIRTERYTFDKARMLSRPAQDATGDVPQLDPAIPTPAGQCTAIRTKHERPYHVRVSPPHSVQGTTALGPHKHFPAPTSSGPVFPAAADGDRC